MDPNNGGWEPVQAPSPQPQTTQSQPQASSDGWEPVPAQGAAPGNKPLPGNPTGTMQAHHTASAFDGHENSDSDYHQPGEGTGEWLGKEAMGLPAGIGRGIFSTISGATDLAHHMGVPVPQGVTDTLHDLSEKHDNTTSDDVGYGGETLMEFLGGDAALKALSVPDRLAQMSKTWKIIEGSPNLMKALKVGSAALKAGTELTPEEAQLIQKYPKLAKLVHLGGEAARAATVQGGQTLVRTGGDTGAAARDAAATAGTMGVLHGATAGAAKFLGKGRQAAQTIEEMTARGAAAPTSDAVNQQFDSTVNGAFNSEKGTLQNQLDDAASTIHMAGEGAPSQQSLTQFAQGKVAAQRKALSDEYVNGLKKLSEVIDSDPENPTTIPYKGSPLHEAAKSLASEGAENASPLDGALSKTRPGSTRANRMIDSLANLNEAGGEAGEEQGGAHSILGEFINSGESAPEAAGAAGKEGGEGAQLTLQHLTETRRVLGERMRNLGYANSDDLADRQIYKRLIQGVDDTIAHMADASEGVAGDLAGESGAAEHETGDFTPEEGEEDVPGTPQAGAGTKARQILDQMNAKYRNGIRPFQNADVKMLLKGNQNDVVKKLISGGTSIDDINAVRKVIGPSSLKTLGDSSIQNMIKGAADDFGDVDYKKLFKQWQRINPDVRKAMFGDTGDKLSAALQTAHGSSNALNEIDKQIQGLLGNGDMESIIKSPDKVREIAKVVGPDGMKTLGQSMLEQKIGEASRRLDPKSGQFVADRFDPDKLLEWWNSFKDAPEVRDMLFHPDAKSKEAYTTLMKNVGQASSVKKLVKYGLLPATVGTAGVIHGPVAALVAATAGIGDIGAAHFGSARGILDHIANNPRTWRLLSAVGKGAEAAHSAPAATVAKKAAYNVMKSAGQALGADDSETQAGQQ